MPTTKKITLAKYAGFCYGVKRAVDTVKKLKESNPDKNVYVLGELIHNAQIIEELSNLGIKTVKEIPHNSDGYCVIRTHGQSPETFEDIKKSGLEVIDLTCPYVKKVQQKAIELINDGYFLVIVGKEEHPEVESIKANASLYGDKIFVTCSIEELRNKEQELKENKIGIVVQTTQTLSALNPIVEYLTSVSKELHIINTICPSTSRRQKEVLELSKENDLMVIVGSKKSANTTHLADISKEFTQTIHIETAKELDEYKDLIANSQNVGISAGASTPKNIIDNVVGKIKIMS